MIGVLKHRSRWSFPFLAITLFTAFALLSFQAVGMWSLGPLDAPIRWLYRMSEVALVPFTLFARIVFPPEASHHVPGFFWLRAAAAALCYAPMLAWLCRFLHHCFTLGDAATDEGRRRVVKGGAALTAATASFGIAAWATGVVPSQTRLRTYHIVIEDLPRYLDGFRIAHLTDTHLGPFISADHILDAIAVANATEPDLTVLTGDYVHRTPDSIEPGVRLFERVRARLGAIAVLGNHDHWEGADACRQAFARIRIPLIDNDRLFVTPEGLSMVELESRSLAVCGVGDLWEDTVDLDAALRNVSPRCPRILLAHNPDFAEQAHAYHQNSRVDLQISGHTHGGQVFLPAIGAPLVPSRYGDKYEGGLVEGPRWPVIVSRGVGMAVLPLRFGVEPEIGLIELVHG